MQLRGLAAVLGLWHADRREQHVRSSIQAEISQILGLVTECGHRRVEQESLGDRVRHHELLVFRDGPDLQERREDVLDRGIFRDGDLHEFDAPLRPAHDAVIASEHGQVIDDAVHAVVVQVGRVDEPEGLGLGL